MSKMNLSCNQQMVFSDLEKKLVVSTTWTKDYIRKYSARVGILFWLHFVPDIKDEGIFNETKKFSEWPKLMTIFHNFSET